MQPPMHTRYAFLPTSLIGVCIFAGLLSGCGSNASAAATASTACPTRVATSRHTVSGAITALTATSATMTTSTEGTITILFTATTRVSVLTTVPRSALVAGTVVQVVVGQSNSSGVGTVAQSILVQTGQTGTTFGGTGGRGGAGGPGRSFNPACRTQATTTTAALRGVRGTITTINLAQNQFTVTDQQGGSYVFTLTSATVLAQQAPGTMSSLKVGDTLSVTGQQTSTGLQASIIQDQTEHA